MAETEAPSLTDQQRNEIRAIIFGSIREYWADEEIKQIARSAAEATVDRLLEHGVAAKVRAAAEIAPEKMVEEMFRRSGHIVKTDSSAWFDKIVAGILQDEASGLPEAIRQHVREHLVELVQRAVGEIVAAMIVQFLKNGADGIAQSTRDMMQQAFMNASIRTGY